MPSRMYHIVDPQQMWQAHMIRRNGIAALTFLVWDICITYDDEVSYIWSQPKTSALKWLFLLLRYFALAAQLRLVALNFALGSHSLETCRALFTTQMLSGGLLMASIMAILMMRVYVFYNRNRWIAATLLTSLGSQLIAMPFIHHFILSNAEFSSFCMLKIEWSAIALFGVTIVLPQLMVLGLTLVKYVCAVRAGWGRAPVVSRLVRDGVWVAVTVFVMWIAGSCFTAISHLLVHVGYYWLLSLIPVVGCRAVVKMQRLRVTRSSYSSPEFTTFVADFEFIQSTSSVTS